MSENQFPIYGVKVKVPRANPEIWIKTAPPPPKPGAPIQTAQKPIVKTNNTVRPSRNYQQESKTNATYAKYNAIITTIQKTEMRKMLQPK